MTRSMKIQDDLICCKRTLKSCLTFQYGAEGDNFVGAYPACANHCILINIQIQWQAATNFGKMIQSEKITALSAWLVMCANTRRLRHRQSRFNYIA